MGIWAEIKYALNSTLGTSGFKPLNELLDDKIGGTQTFTTGGTFTVPTGVHKILITAFGGGQSGSGNNPGAGGDGGNYIVKMPFAVTPNQKIAITIGKGGVPTSSSAVNGGSTVIGNLVTVTGGGNKGNGAKGGEICSTDAEDKGDGGDTPFASGGLHGSSYASYGKCSGGGGAGYGNGANAPAGSRYSTQGNPGGIGAGGSGSATSSSDSSKGGAGGDGIVIIEW